MNQNTLSSKHITTLLFGVASISVGLATGCPKDKYYYDASGGKGTPDMTADAQPDLAPADCTSANDCPMRDNTEATCTAQGTCEYTCAQGWGDPEGKINAQGCTCDTSISSCKLEATCGDGFKEGQEQCDDGTKNSDETPDTCRTSCKDPSCGDKVQDAGEACDDGNQDNTDACTTQCTPCGNGKLDGGEVCDDGNFTDGDGCSATCQIEDLWACDETSAPSECWEEWGPPGDPDLIKGFGQSMANTEDVLVIGAPEDSTVKSKQGSVFVYRQVEGKWKMVQRIDPPAEYEADNLQFGLEVALHKNELAILATNHEDVGTILIYRLNSSTGLYEQKSKVNQPSPTPGSCFGRKIILSDKTLITNAPCANRFDGQVIIFYRSDIYTEFNYTPHVINGDATYNRKLFAHDLHVINDKLFISTPLYDVDGTSSSDALHGRIHQAKIEDRKSLMDMTYIDGSNKQGYGVQLQNFGNKLYIRNYNGVTQLDQDFKNPKPIESPYKDLTRDNQIVLHDRSSFGFHEGKLILISKMDTMYANGSSRPKIFIYENINTEWILTDKTYDIPDTVTYSSEELLRGSSTGGVFSYNSTEPNISKKTLFIRAGNKIYPINL